MEVCEVTNALSHLYNAVSSPRARRRADSYLQRFQRSPEATRLCLMILSQPIPLLMHAAASSSPATSPALPSPHAHMHVSNGTGNQNWRVERAFAASTIYLFVSSYVRKYKLDDMDNWTEQDRLQHAQVTSEFSELCQQVWNLLTNETNAPLEEINVQMHLALAIAVILLRFHDCHCEATIVNSIEWLVQNQPNGPPNPNAPNAQQVVALTNFASLVILKVIPEEVNNKRVKFIKAKRLECQMIIQKSTNHVIQHVLPSIAASIDAQDSQHRLGGLLLQCFASWVEFGDVSSSLLAQSVLLERAFTESIHATFSEDAFTCIRELVRKCNDDSFIPLMELMMKNFVVLGQHVLDRVHSGHAEDVHFCLHNCATSISECGQGFITYFVENSMDVKPGSLVYEFLETILAFTSLPDMDLSNETMDFWVDFRTYISGKNEDRMEQFDAFVARLLGILVERTQYPEQYERLSESAKDRFHAYRNDVRAVFRSLATVSVANEDRFVVDAIHVIFKQYELVDAGAVDDSWWRRTEVYVHALSALSKSIREEDTSLVPRLFELLAREKPFHRALMRTITIFLGVMSHWFARNPTYLELAFRILSISFELKEDTELFPFRQRNCEDHVGAVALKKLSIKCGYALCEQTVWLEALLHLYNRNRMRFGQKGQLEMKETNGEGDGTESEDEPLLETSSVGLIVDSIANLMNCISYERATPIVDALCASMLEDLAKYAQVIQSQGRGGDLEEECMTYLCDILDHLKILATRITSQQNQSVVHPVLGVLQRHWTLFESILQYFGNEEDVVTKMCEFWVALLDNIRTQALEFASALVALLLDQFAKSFQGSYLLVIKSILGFTGEEEETLQSLTRVLVIIVETCLARFQAAGNAEENPQLVVALYDLVTTCGSFRPVILVQSQQLEPLLALSLQGLQSSQTPEIGDAILKFLTEVNQWHGEIVRMPTQMLDSKEMESKVKLYELIQQLYFDKDFLFAEFSALLSAIARSLPPNQLDMASEVIRSSWICFGRAKSEETVSRVMSDENFAGSQVGKTIRNEFVMTISRTESTDNARKFRRVLSSFCEHFRRALSRPASP